MASITVTLNTTDHASIEQNETGGFTITFPRVGGADIDDAICVHNGPLMQIIEDNNRLNIVIEL